LTSQIDSQPIEPLATILNPHDPDPFNTAALPLDSLTSKILNFVKTHHYSCIWTAEASISYQSLGMKTCDLHMKKSIDDKGSLASLLAFGSAMMLHTPGEKDPKTSHAIGLRMMQYKATAIENLVLRLNSRPDKTTLMITMYLLNLEVFSRNLEASRIHMSAVHNIVKELGGLSSLREICREYVLVVTTNAALILNEEAPFSVEEWDPGPILKCRSKRWSYESLHEELSHSLKLAGLESIDLHGICCTTTCDLIDSLNELFAVEKLRESKLTNTQKHNDVYRWIRLRVSSCQYQLHQLRVTEMDAADERRNSSDLEQSQQHQLNVCVCIGAYFASVIIIYQGRVGVDQWGFFDEWRAALLQCLDELVSLAHNKGTQTPATAEETVTENYDAKQSVFTVLLWATVMGAIAHKMQARRCDLSTKAYCHSMRVLIQALELSEPEDVKTTCARMLWNERLMAGPLLEVLGEATGQAGC
jgi:hypothetical protein